MSAFNRAKRLTVRANVRKLLHIDWKHTQQENAMRSDAMTWELWDDLPACTSCLTKEKRIQAAEAALYNWACGHFQQEHVKNYCLKLGFVIDLRQADAGASLQATYFVDGTYVTLEI